jgi:hypothetical protein
MAEHSSLTDFSTPTPVVDHENPVATIDQPALPAPTEEKPA